MNQEIVEKLHKVAEHWHIGVGELLERYEKNLEQDLNGKNLEQDLNEIAKEIVQGYKARLKELLEKEQKQTLNKEEYMERVILASNYL